MRRAAFALALLACGCSGERPFTEPVTLGGQEVSAERLNRGRAAYQQYCRPCHGDGGDGRGPASPGLRPPPRDFSQALFKFAHTPAPALPPDDELKAIVRRGLNGTAMLPWDLPERELDDLVQYLKTFSPRWRSEAPGQAVQATADPFEARDSEGVALGARVYHEKAMCARCHPTYQAKPSAEPDAGRLITTEYCLAWKPGWKDVGERECLTPHKVLPPSFARDPLRSVHAGSELVDLYRVIAAGIPGASMPAWQGALSEEELWGLAHYVRSLLRLREAPAP